MAGFALFLLAAATAAAPAERAPTQSRATASASVSVVIVRAERVGEAAPADGARRQVRQRGDTILVEFN